MTAWFNLSVKELAKVGDRGGLPWVHGAVHGVEVGDPLNGDDGSFILDSTVSLPVVGDEQGKHQVHHWSLREWLKSENTLYTLFWHDHHDKPYTYRAIRLDLSLTL